MVLSYQFSEYHVDFFHYIDHNYFALFEKIRHSIFETGLAAPWFQAYKATSKARLTSQGGKAQYIVEFDLILTNRTV